MLSLASNYFIQALSWRAKRAFLPQTVGHVAVTMGRRTSLLAMNGDGSKQFKIDALPARVADRSLLGHELQLYTYHVALLSTTTVINLWVLLTFIGKVRQGLLWNRYTR